MLLTLDRYYCADADTNLTLPTAVGSCSNRYVCVCWEALHFEANMLNSVLTEPPIFTRTASVEVSFFSLLKQSSKSIKHTRIQTPSSLSDDTYATLSSGTVGKRFRDMHSCCRPSNMPHSCCTSLQFVMVEYFDISRHGHSIFSLYTHSSKDNLKINQGNLLFRRQAN